MRAIVFVWATWVLSGCTHTQLRLNSVNQAETIMDVHYQQVVDNLSIFDSNPNVLPRIAIATAGLNQVSDTLTGSTTETYSAARFTGWGFTLGGNRNMSGNWSLRPVIESDRLARLRCAFQIVVGASNPCAMDECQCVKCLEEFGKMGLLPSPPTRPLLPQAPIPLDVPEVVLSKPTNATELERLKLSKKIAKNNLAAQKQYDLDMVRYEMVDLPDYHRNLQVYLSAMMAQIDCPFPRGWFCIADRKWDVPCGACYVSKCGERYVYVMPDGMEGLTRFTLTVMTLASTDPVSTAAEVVRTVSPDGDVLEYKITTKEKVERFSPIPRPTTEESGGTLWPLSIPKISIPGFSAPSAAPTAPQGATEKILPTGQQAIEIRRDDYSSDQIRSLIQSSPNR